MKTNSFIDGPAVRRLRLSHGLSLGELADAVGVTKGFVSLLERNETGVGLDNAKKIAKVLEVDVSSILQGSRCSGDAADKSNPRWLDFLTSRYNLSRYDQNLLTKFVTDSRLPESVKDESEDEFRSRWDTFYKTVQKFLPNSTERFFNDSEVCALLSLMDIVGAKSWNQVRRRFLSLVKDKCGDGAGMATGGEWKNHVARLMHIEELRIDGKLDLSTLFNVHPELASASIMGGVAHIMSNPRMSAALYEKPTGGYVLLRDIRGQKEDERDFPFWHEAARLLVDPLLKTGRGVPLTPVGIEQIPVERLLCRLASWFAFGYAAAESFFSGILCGCGGTMDKVRQAAWTLYPQMPLRMGVMAFADVQPQPVVFVDASLRLKHPELVAKGIKVEEVERMRCDPDAKLRIGYVFANIAAEEAGVELRIGMRIADGSPISKSFVRKTTVQDNEDFSSWDYNLTWNAVVSAIYGDNHVYAIVAAKAGGENV